MSLTLIIVLLAVIKLSIAAMLLLLPFLHDSAMQQPDGPSASDDDGGLRIARGGNGRRPRWPVSGGPTGPRDGGHGTLPHPISRRRGAHTPPVPAAPQRVRSPLPRQPAQPAAR
jgi:hypothetical protein